MRKEITGRDGYLLDSSKAHAYEIARAKGHGE